MKINITTKVMKGIFLIIKSRTHSEMRLNLNLATPKWLDMEQKQTLS